VTARKDSDRTASLHAPVGEGKRGEVRLTVATLTDPGLVRTNNEDSFVVADLSAGAPAPFEAGVLGPKGVLLAVSDGMGGHSSGEVASGLAVEHLREALLAEWSRHAERDAVAELRNDLRTAVDRANRAVLGHAAENPESEGMGATLTAAVVLRGRLLVAHVGDSRCYLLRERFLKTLTSDQSLAEELVRRGILQRGTPAYTARRSILTRVIGQKGLLEPESEIVELARGDRILLCSDGLYGPVEEEIILETLAEAGSPAEAVATLVEEAKRGGAPDNVTCIVAWVEGEGLPAPGDLDSGGGTVSVAMDAALAAADDATLTMSEAVKDATGEFDARAVQEDDTLSGAVVPPASPPDRPAFEPAPPTVEAFPGIRPEGPAVEGDPAAEAPAAEAPAAEAPAAEAPAAEAPAGEARAVEASPAAAPPGERPPAPPAGNPAPPPVPSAPAAPPGGPDPASAGPAPVVPGPGEEPPRPGAGGGRSLLTAVIAVAVGIVVLKWIVRLFLS